METTPLAWEYLGRAPYRPVWDAQEACRQRVLADGEGAERVMFVEHDPVITLGRAAREANILLPEEELSARGVEVVRTNRGGDVTYHGPGQLVIYPVVRLRAGVVRHLQTIAAAIAAELEALGVRGAAWRRDPAGVWIAGRKIASCGIHVSRGVSVHGFALNVTDEPLGRFAMIVPCGLSAVQLTSVERELGASPPPLASIASSLAARLAHAWGRRPFLACDRMPAR